MLLGELLAQSIGLIFGFTDRSALRYLKHQCRLQRNQHTETPAQHHKSIMETKQRQLSANTVQLTFFYSDLFSSEVNKELS